MSVTLLCPNLRCRAVLQVPDAVRGKTVRCGHCATVFAVPFVKAAAKSDSSTGQAANAVSAESTPDKQ